MKLLVDVNVILDVVLAREPWAEVAAELLARIHDGEHDGFVAAHTVTTVHYLVARARDDRAARLAVTDLLDVVEVVPVGEAELQRALALGLPDYEDAVQAACALAIDADAIVSRDAVGFEGCGVAVVGAAVF